MVIRAKNEARFIGETLAAMFDSATLAPRQVIVVDSGSTDGTQAIVRSFPTTLVQIRPEDFTYGYALNLGVASVDAEIVATLGDTRVICVAKEVTKLHETFFIGPAADVQARLAKASLKGEFVLLIAPRDFEL